uniref:Uncharacterized protein n=1 Tax=Tetraselmis sp. GSL018 TaxID=582737 RepID=A0A061RZ97_9CHLO
MAVAILSMSGSAFSTGMVSQSNYEIGQAGSRGTTEWHGTAAPEALLGAPGHWSRVEVALEDSRGLFALPPTGLGAWLPRVPRNPSRRARRWARPELDRRDKNSKPARGPLPEVEPDWNGDRCASKSSDDDPREERLAVDPIDQSQHAALGGCDFHERGVGHSACKAERHPLQLRLQDDCHRPCVAQVAQDSDPL